MNNSTLTDAHGNQLPLETGGPNLWVATILQYLADEREDGDE